MPQLLPDDTLWQMDSHSFEMRVDNQTLAHWVSGGACCEAVDFQPRLATVLDILCSLVRHEGWHLRWQWSDWVVWQPREKNILADMLANLCLDRQQSLAVRCCPPPAHANFITVSDGASRASSQKSSASWAVLSIAGGQCDLVAAGAVCIDHFASSLDAELVGLELALGALLKISRGYADVVPHIAQLTLDESEFQEVNHHLWSISSYT